MNIDSFCPATLFSDCYELKQIMDIIHAPSANLNECLE